MDNSKLTVLSFLCLYAAFDTTDHDILLHRLHRYVGVLAYPALQWIILTYLAHCLFQISSV